MAIILSATVFYSMCWTCSHHPFTNWSYSMYLLISTFLEQTENLTKLKMDWKNALTRNELDDTEKCPCPGAIGMVSFVYCIDSLILCISFWVSSVWVLRKPLPSAMPCLFYETACYRKFMKPPAVEPRSSILRGVKTLW